MGAVPNPAPNLGATDAFNERLQRRPYQQPLGQLQVRRQPSTNVVRREPKDTSRHGNFDAEQLIRKLEEHKAQQKLARLRHDQRRREESSHTVGGVKQQASLSHNSHFSGNFEQKHSDASRPEKAPQPCSDSNEAPLPPPIEVLEIRANSTRHRARSHSSEVQIVGVGQRHAQKRVGSFSVVSDEKVADLRTPRSATGKVLKGHGNEGLQHVPLAARSTPNLAIGVGRYVDRSAKDEIDSSLPYVPQSAALAFAKTTSVGEMNRDICSKRSSAFVPRSHGTEEFQRDALSKRQEGFSGDAATTGDARRLADERCGRPVHGLNDVQEEVQDIDRTSLDIIMEHEYTDVKLPILRGPVYNEPRTRKWAQADETPHILPYNVQRPPEKRRLREKLSHLRLLPIKNRHDRNEGDSKTNLSRRKSAVFSIFR